MCIFRGFLGSRLDLVFVKGRLVDLDVFPGPGRSSEADRLLSLVNIALPQVEQILVEFLQCFVVHVRQEVNIGKGHIDKAKEECCSLLLQ